jgi:hypothetical protein
VADETTEVLLVRPAGLGRGLSIAILHRVSQTKVSQGSISVLSSFPTRKALLNAMGSVAFLKHIAHSAFITNVIARVKPEAIKISVFIIRYSGFKIFVLFYFQ